MSQSNEELQSHLDSGLRQLNSALAIDINASVAHSLLMFVHLLHKWNRVYNLTAVREPMAMIDRHLLDSLVLCAWLAPESCSAADQVDVIDVGSGAGLPVIPLALARPDLKFVSIESNGKKTRFQQQALVELQIKNVEILNQRVEEVAKQTDTKGSVVTSRAFSAPHDFLQIADSLCADQARAIVMLGQAERLKTPIPEPFKLQELVQVDIPGSSADRHVAVCRRNAP